MKAFVGLGMAIVALSGCALIPGSSSGTISPDPGNNAVSLKCGFASGGTCYFLVGTDHSEIYPVKAGETLSIPSPKDEKPVCVSHSPTFTKHCKDDITLKDGGNVTLTTGPRPQ